MITQSKKSSLFSTLNKSGFSVEKDYGKAFRVYWYIGAGKQSVDIEIERMESGHVLYIDPLPITCNVNLYEYAAKIKYAELTRILAILNSKLLKN